MMSLPSIYDNGVTDDEDEDGDGVVDGDDDIAADRIVSNECRWAGSSPASIDCKNKSDSSSYAWKLDVDDGNDEDEWDDDDEGVSIE